MKTVLIFVLDEYADWEVAYLSSAIYMLGDGRFQTKIVGQTKENVRSIGGFSTTPDYSVGDVPEEYEALILCGGMTWRQSDTAKIAALAKECHAKGRILGAICDASTFLGKVGLLNEGKHTSNMLENMKAWAGENYTGDSNYLKEAAVCDSKIITANGTAPLEFAREVLLALQVADEVDIREWYNFHKLGQYNAPYPEKAK